MKIIDFVCSCMRKCITKTPFHLSKPSQFHVLFQPFFDPGRRIIWTLYTRRFCSSSIIKIVLNHIKRVSNRIFTVFLGLCRLWGNIHRLTFRMFSYVYPSMGRTVAQEVPRDCQTLSSLREVNPSIQVHTLFFINSYMYNSRRCSI